MRNMYLTDEQKEKIRKQQAILEHDQYERRRDYLKQLTARQHKEAEQHDMVHHATTISEQQDSFSVAAAVAEEEVASFINDYSLDFDGSDDFAQEDIDASSPIKDITTTFSVSGWLKSAASWSNVNVKYTAFHVRGSTGWGYPSVFIGFKNNWTTPQATWYCYNEAGSGFERTIGSAFANVTDASVDPSDNDWHHMIVTCAASGTNNIKLYYDGVKIDEQTKAFNATGKEFDKNISIAKQGRSAAQYFHGNIDECAVWDAELSAADVTAIYNSGVANDLTSADSYDTDRTGNLVGWWRNGDGTEAAAGDTIYDMSGVAGVTDLTMSNMDDADYETDVPS